MPGSNNNQYMQSVRFPMAYKEPMDWLIRWGYYPHRSEIIRTAMRDLLRMEAPEQFYTWFPKSRKKEQHSAPTTVFLDPELLLHAQNTIKEQPSQYKNISVVVNRALKWYFKYLTEGARLWEQLLEGEQAHETVQELQTP